MPTRRCEPARHYARIGFLDTIAVGIGGADDEASRIARRVMGASPGPALGSGTGERVGALEAAFINGVAANVLDFDDCTDNLEDTLSSPILPALIALAEEMGASGRDVLTAYVVGFEVETCRARREFPSLREGLASDGDARRVRRGGRLRTADAARRATDDPRARAVRVARGRRQIQPRVDGQADACRQLLAQWLAGRPTCRRGLH